MNGNDRKIWFLASCVELVKKDKNIKGREAYGYLLKKGAVDYLIDNSKRLRDAGADQILESVAKFIGGSAEGCKRIGFMPLGQINIPADYYRMGEKRIIKLFEATQ